MSIHSQQGPRPTPRVTIAVPQTPQPEAADLKSEPAQPPKLADVSPHVEPTEAPRAREATPMRTSRVRAIWGLTLFSLMPGVAVGVAPTFWHGLPSWAHWTAYGFSGILISAIVGLIVKDDGARG